MSNLVGRFANPRTLDFLQSNSIALPRTISQLRISYFQKGAGNSGARKFLYDFVPPLRFHNPHVEITRNKMNAAGSTPSAEIVLQDGSSKTIDVSGKDARGVLQAILDLKL
jgi:hypothetical protein